MSTQAKIYKKAQPYGFISAGLLVLILLMLLPIVTVIIKSTVDNYIVTPKSEYVGLKNYVKILVDNPLFYGALWHTIVFTFFSVVFHLVVGLMFALLLNYPLRSGLQSLFRVLMIVPWAFTVAIVAINWRLLLDPLGIINHMLKSVGFIDRNIAWFGEPTLAMVALIIVNIWRGYPFIMVSLLAGLQGIPTILYEAGKIDGANVVQRFFHITIPQLRPVILSIGLLDSIWTFRLFPMIWLTTGGGPGHRTETLSTYTYRLAFNRFKFSEASAMAVVVLICTSALAVFYIKQQKNSN